MALPLLAKIALTKLVSVFTSDNSRIDEMRKITEQSIGLLKKATTFHVCAGKYDGSYESSENPEGENIKYSKPFDNLQAALVESMDLIEDNYGFVFIEHLGQRSYLKV